MGTAWVARPWGNRAQPIADKLNAMIHSARTIVVFNEASLPAVKDMIATAREDLIRPPNQWSATTTSAKNLFSCSSAS